MTDQPTRETLERYHDGELAPRDRAALTDRLAGDPEAKAYLEQLRQDDLLLQAAFTAPLSEPVATERRRAIEDLLDSATRPAGGSAGWLPAEREVKRYWIPAIAASLLALLIGGGGGFFLADRHHAALQAALEAQRAADRATMDTAIEEALERRVSGVTVDWHSPGSGAFGSVTPVRTFRNQDGRWCREYARTYEMGGRREVEQVIACREGDGQWVTRLISATRG